MKIREHQIGVVNFTWVSEVTWALRGLKHTFMLHEDSQPESKSQSEHGSQNAQSTGQHGMTEPDHSQFFSGTDLKLVFEKANIKGNLSFFIPFFFYLVINSKFSFYLFQKKKRTYKIESI